MVTRIVMPNQNGPEGAAAAMRAAYDSPKGSGYVEQLPAYGAFDASAMTAPGSEGIPSNTNAGGAVGDAVVSNPFGSSQLGVNTPTVTVYAGDTASMSDDVPIHDNTPLLPGGRVGNAPDATGAGEGSANKHRHPNNPNTSTGSAQ